MGGYSELKSILWWILIAGWKAFWKELLKRFLPSTQERKRPFRATSYPKTRRPSEGLSISSYLVQEKIYQTWFWAVNSRVGLKKKYWHTDHNETSQVSSLKKKKKLNTIQLLEDSEAARLKRWVGGTSSSKKKTTNSPSKQDQTPMPPKPSLST